MSILRSFFSRITGSRPEPQIQPWQRAVLDRLDDFLRDEANRRLDIEAFKPITTAQDSLSEMIDQVIKQSRMPLMIADTEKVSLPSVTQPADGQLSGHHPSLIIMDEVSEVTPEVFKTARSRMTRGAGKRFRRSKEEIALGLTADQARLRRQEAKTTKLEGQLKLLKPAKSPSATVRVRSVEVPIERPVPEPTDMLDMLSEPQRSRAKLVVQRKREGKTDVLKTAELDAEIARRIAQGKVTKLPAGLDSTGFQHFPS